MPLPPESPGVRLRRAWGHLSGRPGGKWLFSRILGLMIPYTGKLGATVVELERGRARVRLRERRAVRNHLKSFHAMSLANLAELTTGLAVLGGLPDTVRGILVGFEISYVKKARGTLHAEATCEIPEVTEAVDYAVEANIVDEAGDIVATARALWRLGPTKPQAAGA